MFFIMKDEDKSKIYFFTRKDIKYLKFYALALTVPRVFSIKKLPFLLQRAIKV